MRYITRTLLAGLVSVLCFAAAPQAVDAAGSVTPMINVGCCR
jgi:hypothetical protein